MIELPSVVVSAVRGFVPDLAVHRNHLHSKKRGEVKRRLSWDREEAEKD